MSKGFRSGQPLNSVTPRRLSTAGPAPRGSVPPMPPMHPAPRKRPPRKKKKRHLLPVLLGLAVLLAVLLAGGVFLLGRRKMTKETAEKLIRDQVSAVLSYDDTASPLLQAVMDELDVQVQQLDRTDSGYTAVCVLRNHDYAGALEQAQSQLGGQLSLTDYTAALADIYRRQPYLEQQATILLSETDGVYFVQLTEEQLDMCTGGVLSYYESNYGTVETDDSAAAVRSADGGQPAGIRR